MRLFLLLFAPLVAHVSSLLSNTRGISIYGLETDHRGFVCDWVKPVDFYITELDKLGFNSIRVPFSYQWVQEGDFSKMDHLFDLCQKFNMSVLLDFHRVWSWHQGPSPFENGVSLDQFINCWLTVLRRYERHFNLIGHNIYNEYQGEDVETVRHYTEELIKCVEAEFPGRFIYFPTGTRWAGSLVGMSMEHLPFKDRIYYSIHKYSFSGDGSQRDWENSFANLSWLPSNRTVIGEFGWDARFPEQEKWAYRFLTFLQDRNITNTFYWTLANSHDTGNMYQDDCVLFNWQHYNLLKKFWLGNMRSQRFLRG